MAARGQQPVLAPPVDNLKLVTAYPKARATMNDAKLRTLVPAGTPCGRSTWTILSLDCKTTPCGGATTTTGLP